MSSGNRPWQGTVLGVFSALGLALMVLMVIVLLVAGAYIMDALTNYGLPVGTISSSVIALLILPFIVLYVFMTLGLFKGQKWTVIVYLVFTILGTITNLLSFNIIGLLFNAFFIYLCIVSMKDSYYNS